MNANVSRLHEATMAILGRVGVRFHDPASVEVLKSHGIKVEGGTAFFTEEQVMHWVKKAPSQFQVRGRDPQKTITLGNEDTNYAPGFGSTIMVDESGQPRSALAKDYVEFGKLVQVSPLMSSVGGVMVQPSDIDPAVGSPSMFYMAARLSDKPLIGMCGTQVIAQQVLDMTAMVAGGYEAMRRNPMLITPINTLSPLAIDDSSLQAMTLLVQNNQPVMISPCTMAGSTGPVTMAGTIAVGNAEILAGVTLAQMINPGAPVMYGFQSTAADMRTGGIAMGCPERALCIYYAAELAKMYGLPVRGGGADNDAPWVTMQSGYESMMNLMETKRSGYHFVLHAAGIMCGFAAMSAEKFIADLEIISMVERRVGDINTDAEHMALDVIEAVGPGGEYLTQPHTLKWCRQENWRGRLGHMGKPGLGDSRQAELDRQIREKRRMLDSYRMPDMDPSLLADLRGYLNQLGCPTATMDALMEA